MPLLPIVVLVSAAAAAPERIDPGRLEAVEAASESLADALDELASRAASGRSAELAPYFAATVRCALPSAAGEPTPERPLVLRRRWTIVPEHERRREAALPEVQRLLDALGDLEDVRIELTSAAAVGTGEPIRGLEGRFAASVITRDGAGRREWLRGAGRLAASRAEDAWSIEALVFDEATSLVAARTFFVDVTGPAGMEVADPSFEARGLTGLLAHGAAAGDLDGDGRIDVVSTGKHRNFVYLNVGDGTFREAAAELRLLTFPVPGVAPLLLDHDGDGDLDLFVTSLGPQQLHENRLVPDGRLVFRDVSTRAGVDVPAFGFSAAAGDVTGDGRPDVHVACYGDYGRVMPDGWDGTTNGTANLLFVNQGDGTFREEAAARGVAGRRWSYAAVMGDVDDDGDLDLVVANDFGDPVGLYLNDGGRFTDAAGERGLGDPAYGMGASLGDPDNDGDLDLHVTRLSSVPGRRILERVPVRALPSKLRLEVLASGNALYRNDGRGRFTDVTSAAGPFPAGWAWGGGFADLDGDGFEDLHVPNGFVSGRFARDTDAMWWRQVVASKVEAESSLAAFGAAQVARFREGDSFAGRERDLVMLNRGDASYLDVSGITGLDDPGDGRAAVVADFDDDGDLDVFLRAMHARAHVLLRNEIGQDPGFVRVAVEGRAPGRDAFGAVVRLKTSAGILTRVKAGGSGFLAQSDPRLLFGLGADAAAEWLEVTWPGGRRQRMPGPKAGQSVVVVEGREGWSEVAETRFRLADPDGDEGSDWRAVRLARGAPYPGRSLLPAPGGRAQRTVVTFTAPWAPASSPVAALAREMAARSGERVRAVEVSIPEAPALFEAVAVRPDVAPLTLVLDGELRVRDVVVGGSRRALRRLERAVAAGST